MSKELVNFLEKDTEVVGRLSDLQLNRNQVEEVMKRAINAKLSAVLNHPQNASGTLAYIEGVRAMRDVIGDGKSWKRMPDKGIEYIENSVQKIRMVFQNVDYACDPAHDPQPISKKGEGSKKAVSSNQMALFDSSALVAMPSVWFLCVSENNGIMSAELSLPSQITKSGLFAGFIERIFVSIGRDIEGANNSDYTTEEDYNDDFKITKKII